MNFIDFLTKIKEGNGLCKNKVLYIFFLIKNLKSLILDFIRKKERCMELKKLMKLAKKYEEWKHFANELDELEGKFKWKSKKETSLYNWVKVEQLILALSKKRETKDIKGIIHLIRSNLIRNLYSTASPVLYEISNTGTKLQIEILYDELSKCLEYIANNNDMSLENKLEFFSEVRHNYGKSALMLSGGASLGMYHTGVIKVLYEQNLLPKIICGSSAGSIVAALVCTSRYDDIPKIFDRGLKLGPFEMKDKKYSLIRKIVRFILTGVLFDTEVLKDFLRENIGDFTFQEAYDRTGFILNITVTGYKEHDNNRLLNYLSAPNVLIWSGVAASCAVPSLFEPVQLLCKNEHGIIVPYSSDSSKFIDGSISFDLPMQRLSELFNINNFIVSQTNPYVIPFMNKGTNKTIYDKENGSFNLWKIIKGLVLGELKHRIIQIDDLGILPSFISFFVRLINQQYHGNITIFPIPSVSDISKALLNPSKEMIEDCCIQSSRITYTHINKIEGLLKIELILEKLYFKIKHKQKRNKFNIENKTYLKEENTFIHEVKKANTSNLYDIFDGIDEQYNKLQFAYENKELSNFSKGNFKFFSQVKTDINFENGGSLKLRDSNNRFSEEFRTNLVFRQESFKIPRAQDNDY